MNGELSNVFISYAMNEQEFVRDLDDAFKKSGRTIWTDWDRNPLTASREQELYSRIEAADYFLFIVSPDSITSEVSLKELAHAVKHEKQIVPVVRREAETQPAPLATGTSLFFRRSDNFSASFKSLLQTIDTNLNLAVFISYSRRDREFVEKLESAFRKHGRKIWIDQKDIQHTEEWLKAIYSGIEAADNFVFIISPDSIASKNCAKELAHAVQHNKRLVPVLYRKVIDSEVPQVLADLDWVPFEEGVRVDEAESFDHAFRSLLETIDTDLDYVRAHTRLLTRAIEWDKRQRDKSLLLRGKDLKEAERWLIEAIGKKPPLTQLQLQYIEASRKDARKRLWFIAGTSVLSLAIIVVLTVIAVRRNQEARRQAQLSLSSRLAGDAQKQLDSQLDLALLLSLEAGKAADTFEARSTLLSGLARSSKLITFLRGQRSVPYSLAYSPDGKLLAVGSDATKVYFWDTTTRQLTGSPITYMGSTPTTISFSPDSKTLATGGNTNDVWLWDVATREQLARLPLEEFDLATSVAFNADGKRLVVGTEEGKIILWDVESEKQLAEVAVEDGEQIGRIAFMDADKKVAAFTENGLLVIWNGTNQARLTGRTLDVGMVMGMDFSDDGKMLAVRQPAAVSLYDVGSAKLRFKIDTPQMSGIKTVAFSHDGQRLAVAEGNGNLLLCDVQGRRFIDPPLLGHNKEIYSLAFSPDGKTLASGGLDKNVILWNVEGEQAPGRTLANTRERISDLVFRPDGKTLFTASVYTSADESVDSAISEWDVTTHKQLNRFAEKGRGIITSLRLLEGGKLSTAGLIENLIPSNDSQIINGSDSNGTSTSSTIKKSVVIWDGVNSPRLLEQLQTQYQSGVASTTLSRDGAFLAAGFNNGNILLWDIKRWQQTGEPLLKDKVRVARVVFSPDGKLLASITGMNHVLIWRLSDRQSIGSFWVPHDQDGRSLAFSEDGKMLAVGTTQSIILWDVVNKQKIDAGLTGLQSSANCLAFSPDGKLLASGSFNKSIMLWDILARKPLGAPLISHTQPVSVLSFSPDGQTLVSGSLDGAIILWDLRQDTWRSRACEIANRNLTQEEWDRYIGVGQWRKTCPNLP